MYLILEASSIRMDFRSWCLLWLLCTDDSWWVACILNCCVCRNCGSRSSAFLWAVAVILVLLCFLFLPVYRCVHFVVVYGKVSTGDSGSVIGMEVAAGREPGCWVGKGLGEVAGKDQGRV